MTARWHVDGPAVAGVATLDAVFQSVKTAQQIRAASVAVASGRTIYAKRAYTWAEPGSAATTTTTTFRLASVSKLFTAAAVQIGLGHHASVAEQEPKCASPSRSRSLRACRRRRPTTKIRERAVFLRPVRRAGH